MSTVEASPSNNGRGSHAWADSWTHFRVDRRSPSYCRVSFDHPPTNTITATTVAELAAPFLMSQPAISRHLKVLEEAGLISRMRRATARLSHLEAEPLQEVSDWLARYQEYWDESFERLDTLLAVSESLHEEFRDPSSVSPRC